MKNWAWNQYMILGISGISLLTATLYSQITPPVLSVTYVGDGVTDGRGIAVDSEGIYLTGNTNPVGGNMNLYLNRYDLEGHLLWTRIWGGSDRERGRSIALYNDQVYV
jgi:hypothetical protein